MSKITATMTLVFHLVVNEARQDEVTEVHHLCATTGHEL
jgi:hypothetical protein